MGCFVWFVRRKDDEFQTEGWGYCFVNLTFEWLFSSAVFSGVCLALFGLVKLTNYIRTLTEISDLMKRANEAPLATETILQAFDLTHEDDASPRDEGLVRELILIRLIEVLPQERLKELPHATHIGSPPRPRRAAKADR